MRGQNPRPFFFWLAIVVLMALLAGLALASVAMPGESPPSVSPTVKPSPTPAAAPTGPILSDSRGLITLAGPGSAASLRRETDLAAISSLRGQDFIGAVSGTGRRIAYWVATAPGTLELRVFDATAPDQDTTLTTLLDTERGAAAVWSIDRTGILVVVESSGQGTGGDQPGPFSALRVVDTPTRSIHEIARLTDGSQFFPVAWDRDAERAGACVTGAGGAAIALAVVREDAQAQRTPMDPGIPARTVESNGTAVLGVVNGSVVRVWSLGSYDDHRELGADPGDHIGFARWRPGAQEIVVSVADRVELWPAAGGAHRILARGLPAASALLVSADGAIAIVGSDSGRSAIAIDLGSGRTAPVPMGGEQLLAAVSFR